MGSKKPRKLSGTVGAAVGDAFSELQSLGEECREIVDNAPENLQQSARIETLGESADTLEAMEEPSVPNDISNLEIEWTERAGVGRATRCSNALSAIEAAKERVDAEIGERAVDDSVADLSESLGDIIAEAQNCEFPGMFG